MPIPYRITRDEGLLVASLPARPTLADLRAYAVATVCDPAYDVRLVEVVDATAMTDPAEAAAAFDAARLLSHVAPVPRVRARAIVAPTLLLAGLARRFERETAADGVATRVFRTVGAATQWARETAARHARAPLPA